MALKSLNPIFSRRIVLGEGPDLSSEQHPGMRLGKFAVMTWCVIGASCRSANQPRAHTGDDRADSTLVTAQIAGNTVSERVDWLAANTTRQHSTKSSNDDDFRDLEAFGRAVGNARVVLLGEQSHGDGTVFELKTRLVKYLYERHGFDVLVFESPMYDVARVWVRHGRRPNSMASARVGLAPVYANSSQLVPLWTLIAQSGGTARPIDIAGFDSQFNSRVSQDSLPHDLANLLVIMQSDTGQVTGWHQFRAMLDTLTAGTYYRVKPSSERQAAFLGTLDSLRRLWERWASGAQNAAGASTVGGLGHDYWRELLKSLDSFARDAFATNLAVRDVALLNNARDAQMADNLLWLMRNEYRGRKVIAWGATAHFVHDSNIINTTGARFFGQERYVTMGHHIREVLHDASYVVGFLALEGTYGWPDRGPIPIPTPAVGSIEVLWGMTGASTAFLDFRNLASSGSWLRASLPAGFLGYAPYRADWTRVLDGVFFTRTMTPSTPTQQ